MSSTAIHKLLVKHDSIATKIVEVWIKQYFNILYEEEGQLDWDWVNNDVGSVFCFADYYVSFSTVLECLNENIEPDKFHSWYDWCLENHPSYINLKAFSWGASEVLERDLERKLEAVKNAEDFLKLAIEDYRSSL